VTRATVSADGETITVHIPLTFRKRGGRKRVVTPDGAEWAPRPRVDNAMVKALARAFRWRRMLDEGAHATIEELAKSKGIANLRKDMNRGFDSLGRRLEILDERVGRQFVWLVGIQVMTLAAVVTSLAAILGALADR
jgi:hypothetical protein